ncbi:putative ETO1-like protein 1-like [Trypanosoma grayi]|uniref:putative ETO1-like protein 1-like n=1 Tax=Trypanosoma grayi TaxID=71804 RepID=UPI0004F4775B|nr:putative ETO1-like protein 1-like [Trypanosoma grayi]KEG14914.1 putative ETO1-like protein 1-like [Trypanosoma grayi]
MNPSPKAAAPLLSSAGMKPRACSEGESNLNTSTASIQLLPNQSLGILWNHIFPSLIAPFLCPRDVAQMALVSRTLYRATERTQTWKSMAAVLFDINADAAKKLEELYWELYREAEGSHEACGRTGSPSCESNVQALSVRKRESFSRRLSVDEDVWMLDSESTCMTSYSSLHGGTCRVEQPLDLNESLLMNAGEVGEEGGETQQEQQDGILVSMKDRVDVRLLYSPVLESDGGELQMEAVDVTINDESSTSGCVKDEETVTAVVQDTECPDEADWPYNLPSEVHVFAPEQQCSGSSPLPLTRQDFLDVNTSLVREALECWTAVKSETLPVGRGCTVECEQLLVCAATMTRTAQQCHIPFPWRAYCKILYERCVSPFLGFLKTAQIEAKRAEGLGDLHAAVERLCFVVNTICQGDCSVGGRGAREVVRSELCRTLRLRARLYLRLSEAEAAHNDLCLAELLDDCHDDEVANHTAMMPSDPDGKSVEIEGGLNVFPPCLESEYTRVAVHKDILHRAAFLQRWLRQHGPSALLYLLQYMICDELRLGAPHLLQRAAECATTYERLVVQAWRSYDRELSEAAVSDAELGVSMLPPSFRAWADKESAALCRLLARATEEEILRFIEAKPSGQHTDFLPSSAAFAYFFLGVMGQTIAGVAMDALTKFVVLSPSNYHRAVALLLVAQEYVEKGDTQRCMCLLQVALKLNPTYYPAYSLLAQQQVLHGDMSGAYTTLSMAIQHCHPIPAEAFVRRSRCSLRDPLDDVNAATDLHPRLSYPYRIRAAMLMDKGDSEAAIAEISRIIALTSDPNDVMLRLTFYLDSGCREGALDDLALLVLLAPQQECYRDWFLRSTAFFAWGNEGCSIATVKPGLGSTRRSRTRFSALLLALGLRPDDA